LAAILVIGIGWGGLANGQGTITLGDGVKARLMALEALRGAKVDAGFLAGRPVLVTFFASWCPPCRTEMRGLARYIEANGADKIHIVAVNWIEGLAGRSPARLRSFLRDIHPSIKVVIGTKDVVRDFGGVLSIPAAYIFDKSGQEVFRVGSDPRRPRPALFEAATARTGDEEDRLGYSPHPYSRCRSSSMVQMRSPSI
jgi:thiol-disulfide isomerase/thioredoxin